MLQVELFHATHPLYRGTARQVVLPGEEGEVSLLDCHAPMLCALLPGVVEIDERRFPIRGGLVRVFRNHVTILGV